VNQPSTSNVLDSTEATLRLKADAFPDAGAVGIALPRSDVTGKLPKAAVTVEGTMNGFPFRAPLEPDGSGHSIRLSEALVQAIGVRPAQHVTVEITRIGDEPEVRVPDDLRTALADSATALALWAKITPMARRDWIRWVASAKQEETRARRIENGIDMLHQGKRRPCCFPGVAWVTKDHVSPDETWIPLPDAGRSRPKRP